MRTFICGPGRATAFLDDRYATSPDVATTPLPSSELPDLRVTSRSAEATVSSPLFGIDQVASWPQCRVAFRDWGWLAPTAQVTANMPGRRARDDVRCDVRSAGQELPQQGLPAARSCLMWGDASAVPLLTGRGTAQAPRTTVSPGPCAHPLRRPPCARPAKSRTRTGRGLSPDHGA